MMDLDWGIDDSRKVLATIRNAPVLTRPPKTVQLSRILRLEIGAVVRDLRARMDAFGRCVEKLVRSDAILGGEPVFAKSRLTVQRDERHWHCPNAKEQRAEQEMTLGLGRLSLHRKLQRAWRREVQQCMCGAVRLQRSTLELETHLVERDRP